MPLCSAPRHIYNDLGTGWNFEETCFDLPAGEVDLPLLQSARIGPEDQLARRSYAWGFIAAGEARNIPFILRLERSGAVTTVTRTLMACIVTPLVY